MTTEEKVLILFDFIEANLVEAAEAARNDGHDDITSEDIRSAAFELHSAWRNREDTRLLNKVERMLKEEDLEFSDDSRGSYYIRPTAGERWRYDDAIGDGDSLREAIRNAEELE